MPCLQHVLALGGDLPENDLFADRKALSSLVQRKDGHRMACRGSCRVRCRVPFVLWTNPKIPA